MLARLTSIENYNNKQPLTMILPRNVILKATVLPFIILLLVGPNVVTGFTLYRWQSQVSSSSSLSSTALQVQRRSDSTRITFETCVDRRKAIQEPLIEAAKMIPFGAITMWLTSPIFALAADSSTTTTTKSTTTDSSSTKSTLINLLLEQLRGIPTFCIVSSTTGAAYMIYKRDLNMGLGYAFLTYDGAVTVLNEAKQNAIQKGYSNNVWTNATITTLPLDVAIRLTLKKRNRMAMNNRNDTSKVQSLDTLLQIIPGADERFDGIAIDKDRFQDQGRVPLFYVMDENASLEKTVFYLNRKDLIRDWTQQQGVNTTFPKVGAIDLLGIFESLLLGRNVEGKIGGNTNLLLPTSADDTTQPIPIEFVGNLENIAVAKALKKNGPLTPYNPNQMIL